jgi:type I restriction enzyme M protein
VKQGYALTPGRYVGADLADDDEVLFEARMTNHSERLRAQQEASILLDAEIRTVLKNIGYGW